MVKIKIITDNAVYVQLKDLRFLYETDLDIPGNIMAEFFSHKEYISGVADEEKFLSFIYPQDKKFLIDLDFIVDYKYMVDLEVNELCYIASLITLRLNDIDDLIKKGYSNHDLLLEKEYLNYKLLSVSDFIYYKLGKINIELPKEIKHKIKELSLS